MDIQKIGTFLAELRKEKNFTQEELGEQIGVTNKTVSRWENGNYLPPVEMLQIMSKLYGVSINEILSGERLNDNDYKEKAEKNILTALSNSTATFKEKSLSYKQEWKKKHLLELAVVYLCIFALLICSLIFHKHLLGTIGCILLIIYDLWVNARMNNYVAKNFYDELNKDEK